MPVRGIQLTRSRSAAGDLVVRLGVPLLDEYLEFLAGRCRPNTVLAVGPWNGPWNEYLPDVRVLHASGAFTCAIGAGRTSVDSERPSLNPRVRGSSPWRRTRPDLGILEV